VRRQERLADAVTDKRSRPTLRGMRLNVENDVTSRLGQRSPIVSDAVNGTLIQPPTQSNAALPQFASDSAREGKPAGLPEGARTRLARTTPKGAGGYHN